MNDSSGEMMPKATVAKILQTVLDIYNSGDNTRKADFFGRELPSFLASGDFSYNPKTDLTEKEEQ